VTGRQLRGNCREERRAYRRDVGGPGNPSRRLREQRRTEKIDETAENGKVGAEGGETGEPVGGTLGQSPESGKEEEETRRKGRTFQRTRRST
jgi:hypothetical protein